MGVRWHEWGVRDLRGGRERPERPPREAVADHPDPDPLRRAMRRPVREPLGACGFQHLPARHLATCQHVPEPCGRVVRGAGILVCSVGVRGVQRARGETFDEQPMPDLDSEALDFRAASESFEAVRPLHRRDLETLRLLTDHQGRKVPTVGGILLFGVDRERHFPDAWIQAGRFAGSDKTRIVDRAELRSHLPRAIEEAISFIEKHSMHGAEIGAVRRKERWNLPPVAVREAVINAVAHADYAQRGAPIRVSIFDDRLEIENPGLLPFGLTVEDVQRGISKLRNRVIGRVFHALGLIEQWGSGIQRMTAACSEGGLPDPRLEEVATRFRVTIFTGPVSRPTLDDTDQAIVDALSDGRGRLTSELAALIGLTPRATRTRLARLVGSGLVREVGSGPQDPKRRYFGASYNR